MLPDTTLIKCAAVEQARLALSARPDSSSAKSCAIESMPGASPLPAAAVATGAPVAECAASALPPLPPPCACLCTPVACCVPRALRPVRFAKGSNLAGADLLAAARAPGGACGFAAGCGSAVRAVAGGPATAAAPAGTAGGCAGVGVAVAGAGKTSNPSNASAQRRMRLWGLLTVHVSTFVMFADTSSSQKPALSLCKAVQADAASAHRRGWNSAARGLRLTCQRLL